MDRAHRCATRRRGAPYAGHHRRAHRARPGAGARDARRQAGRGRRASAPPTARSSTPRSRSSSMNRNEATTGEDVRRDLPRVAQPLDQLELRQRREIAYVHGGLYPRRPAAADPDLPVWGTGEWEWQTNAQGDDVYLGRGAVPHEATRSATSSSRGTTARRRAGARPTRSGATASIYRAKLLEDAIRAQKPHSITPVRLVQMMEQAGLTDLRGRYVAPLALRAARGAREPGPREQAMIDLLQRVDRRGRAAPRRRRRTATTTARPRWRSWTPGGSR